MDSKQICDSLNLRGNSLIEVVIAATVGILVVTALTFATIFSLRNATFAKSSAQATKLAQEGIEKVRTLRDRDGVVYYSGSPSASKFSDFWAITFSCSGFVNCYFYFNSSGTFQGGSITIFENIQPNFKRQFRIEDTGTEQKKVTSLVQWADFSGTHESKLVTYLRKL